MNLPSFGPDLRPRGRWERRAVGVAVTYLAVAATWVGLSDVALHRFVEHSDDLSLVKGIAFVVVTSGLLLGMAVRWGRQIDEHLRALWRQRTIDGLISRVNGAVLSSGDLAVALRVLCDDLAELTTAVRVEVLSGIGSSARRVVSGGAPEVVGLRHETFVIYGAGGRPSGSLVLSSSMPAIDRDLRMIGEGLAAQLARTIAIAEQQHRLLQLSTAVEATANAIAIIDVGFRIVWANTAFTTVTGYSADEIVGMRADFLVEDLSAAEAGAAAWRTVLDGHPWRGELLMRRRGGNLYAARHTLTPITDSAGTVVQAISVHDDLTQRRQMEQRLAELATHDPVTTLPNRYLFLDRVEQAIAAAAGQPIAIAMLGLAGFTEVNEALGRQLGDEVLRRVGMRFVDGCADDETVAGVHGDQFAVLLLGETTPEAIAMRTHALLEAVAEPIHIDGREVVLTARAGIAVHPQDGADADELLTHAATAMHLASRLGRDRLAFHAPAHNHAAQERLQLHGDLRRALVHGELVLHFQPQIDLQTERWVGTEALIRWNHPTLGLLPPARFLQVIDESDLSAEVNRWVLDTALAACVELRVRIPAAHIGVNISAAHFHDGDVVGLVAAALADSTVPPGALEIELLENTLFARGSVPPAVGELRAMGVRLAVDDFGTGYNSLARVADLPIDVVKIDRSFVTDIDEKPMNRSIVHAVVGIADALGVTVLAEGVETEREAVSLRALGVDQAQGYHFGRPASLERLLADLDARPDGSSAAG